MYLVRRILNIRRAQQGTLLNPSNGITEEDSAFYIIEEDSTNIITSED